MVKFQNQSLSRSIQENIGHCAPFSSKELAGIKRLTEKQVGELEEIHHLVNLKRLRIKRSKLRDLAFLKSLDGLTSLRVHHSLLEEISALPPP